MEPPLKKQRKALLDDSSDESGDELGGVNVSEGQAFKINEEYARRFEHNKKREELQRLEDKLGKRSVFGKSKEDGDEGDDDDDDSTSEEEDDAAVLATEAVDSEIMATLKAIRSKDPRVYDPNAKFFTSIDEEATEKDADKQEAKPMYLRDYHRQNLLSRANGEADEDEGDAPKTYAQEQEELKQAIVKEMHAVGSEDEDESEGSDDDDFLVKKHKTEKPTATIKITEEDVAVADKDPEVFLSNFMASRAWVPTERSNWAPLESDDDEEDAQAEAFEEAYNFRFEDPNKINERLITHARDTTSKYSVRREEPSSRKKKRDAERQRQEEEKREREEERARLRKLKIEQLEEKVAKVKQAAGIRANDIPDRDWARFLDNDWDDEKWEKEMNKRFNDEYYAEREGDDGEDGSSKKKKVKKPTWDDDIDIKDLVPDFDDEEASAAGSNEDEEMEDADGEPKPKKKKDRLREKKDKQREARKERRKIEQIVDQNLNLETSLLPGNSKKFSGTFRYRESSPTSFGLTARDILFADDADLNKFAGLKKLASFRDPVKKKKDRKHLGKKARLRQWRLDTFGNEDGPVVPEPSAAGAEQAPSKSNEPAEMEVDIREGKKRKRKRSKKN